MTSNDGNAAARPQRVDPLGRRELILLLVLASVQFFSIVDFMVVMPLGPQLNRTLGINTRQFGLVVASYTVAAGIAGLLGSAVLDRFGRRRAYLGLFTGFLLGTLLCGLSVNYATLLLARVVTGVFGGILGGMALAIVGDVFPEERRGRATGVLMSAFALASVLGVPICIALGDRFGWHVPFVLLAAVGLPFLFLGSWVLPPLRDHLTGAVHAHPLAQLRDTFRHPNNLRAFALTFMIMFGGFSIIPYISLYLVGNVGVSETDLTWVYMTGGLLTLVGAPLIGRLADRFGKVFIYRIVALVAAGFMLVMTNLPPVPLAVAMVVFGALMLCNAGRMVAGMAIVTGSVVARQRGSAMSANSAVQHLASGLGALVAGQIIVPSTVLVHFEWVGLMGAAATLLSIWLAGWVRTDVRSVTPQWESPGLAQPEYQAFPASESL